MTAVHPSLGEFEVLHALKAGGMGEVLLARRRGPAGFEQLCAVKTIRPELAATPLVRAMFLDEARLLARLTHPAIAHSCSKPPGPRRRASSTSPMPPDFSACRS